MFARIERSKSGLRGEIKRTREFRLSSRQYRSRQWRRRSGRNQRSAIAINCRSHFPLKRCALATNHRQFLLRSAPRQIMHEPAELGQVFASTGTVQMHNVVRDKRGCGTWGFAPRGVILVSTRRYERCVRLNSIGDGAGSCDDRPRLACDGSPVLPFPEPWRR